MRDGYCIENAPKNNAAPIRCILVETAPLQFFGRKREHRFVQDFSLLFSGVGLFSRQQDPTQS